MRRTECGSHVCRKVPEKGGETRQTAQISKLREGEGIGVNVYRRKL